VRQKHTQNARVIVLSTTTLSKTKQNETKQNNNNNNTKVLEVATGLPSSQQDFSRAK